MKISKKIFAGMAVLALLFGLVLAGCASGGQVTYVETDVSRAIYETASNLVRSNQGNIPAGALLTELGDRFPGLKPAPLLAIQVGLIQFSHEGKNYSMKCSMGEGQTIAGTMGAASRVGPTTPVIGIISVEEMVVVPK